MPKGMKWWDLVIITKSHYKSTNSNERVITQKNLAHTPPYNTLYYKLKRIEISKYNANIRRLSSSIETDNTGYLRYINGQPIKIS